MAYVHLSQHSTFTVGGSMPQLGQHHLLHPTPHLTLQRCGAKVFPQTHGSSPTWEWLCKQISLIVMCVHIGCPPLFMGGSLMHKVIGDTLGLLLQG